MTKTVQHISLKKSAIPGKVPEKDVLAKVVAKGKK